MKTNKQNNHKISLGSLIHEIEDTVSASNSYDSTTGKIQWNGGAFSLAKKSTVAADKRIIFVQKDNENWDRKSIQQ